MAKQIIKGLSMLMLVVALAFVTSVVSAYGQSSRQVATIPFQFSVGDKDLPAGQYDVAGIAGHEAVLKISSSDMKQSVMRMSSPTSRNNSASTGGKLVFRHYANQYFLTEVWAAGENTGRQLAKSARQRAIERELASISSKSEWAQGGYEIIEVAAVRR